MRGSRALASLTCFALLFATEIAAAQSKPPAKSSSQYTLRRDEAGGNDAAAARSRARSGDCAGALPSFDAAIRVSLEPTLRRDRGLCHEKLGHPYPAIEDYRAYLVAVPEANDADQIRQRLAALEAQVGIGGPPEEAAGEKPGGAGVDASASTASGEGSASASASFSLTGGASASSSSSGKRSNVIGPRAGEPERSYDYYRNEEKLSDTAEESPLRRGSGMILGAVILPYRVLWLSSEAGGSSVSREGYAIAASLRYSFGANVTMMGEVGYAGYGTVGRSSATGGIQTLLGIEARIPISKFAADLILLGGGVGYERLSSNVANSDLAFNGLAGRGRFGYRHVFGPSFGLDVLFEPGFVHYFENSGIPGANGPSIGLGLALLIGGEGGT